MPLTPTTVNTILTYKGTLCVYASVHSADPGTTGTSEATGGSYVRKPITWGTPASGSMTGTVAAQQPGTGTWTNGGYWSAATGGTFLGGFTATSKTLGANDTLTLQPTLTQTES